MIIDTHAHLYFPELINDLDRITDQCLANDVNKIIIPAVDLKTIEVALNLTQKYDMLYAAIGLHPSDIKDLSETSFLEIEKYIKNEKVVAIGEIGLDYYWDKSYNDKQKYFFKFQIELAQKYNLPAIVHTRESTSDALEITSKFPDVNFQYHCFSGTQDDLNTLLKKENHYLSYCGNITYKKFDLSNLINTPIDKLLFETDSPFLSPIPHRGKTNYPYHLPHTIDKISLTKNIKLSELKSIVYQNTINFFKFN